jgi:hypothetical protein
MRAVLGGNRDEQLLYDTLNRVVGCAGESEETRQAVLDLILRETCEPGPWGGPSGGSFAEAPLVGRVPMN